MIGGRKYKQENNNPFIIKLIMHYQFNIIINKNIIII